MFQYFPVNKTFYVDKVCPILKFTLILFLCVLRQKQKKQKKQKLILWCVVC